MSRLAFAAFRVLLAVLVPGAAVAGGKPAVPRGRDPGGVAVALIGPGIDYTRPEIANRLARDGEGEIVGFDLKAADRLPYEAGGAGTAVALATLERAPEGRIAVFKAEATDKAAFGGAIGMALSSPAKVVVLFPAAVAVLGPDGLAAVSGRLAGRLLVIAWEAPGEKVEEMPVLPDVIRVCATGQACGPAGGDTVLTIAGSAGMETALAEVASRAARTAAGEPGLSGSDLKLRLTSGGQR